jgi:hypothetical protein
VYTSRQHTRARENIRKTTPEATEMAPIFSVYFPFSSYLFGFVSYSLLLRRDNSFSWRNVSSARVRFSSESIRSSFYFPRKFDRRPWLRIHPAHQNSPFLLLLIFIFFWFFKFIFYFQSTARALARARALPFKTKQSPAASWVFPRCAVTIGACCRCTASSFDTFPCQKIFLCILLGRKKCIPFLYQKKKRERI